MKPLRSSCASMGVRPSLALALAACAGALLGSPALRSAERFDAPSGAAAMPAAEGPTVPAPDTGFVYDREYPFIGYSDTPKYNDIARLAARMKAGKVHLEYRAPRGYLGSLLKARGIDGNSQTLVFSKTSLQSDLITPDTPRAIYFNDDTYIAWISQTKLIEISTMDSMMGTVFYTMLDLPAQAPHFERETTRCLACHDTYSLSGGGVPNFLFLSAYTRRQQEIVTNDVAAHTTDSTPLDDRWGGWYVTGQLGGLEHLGDILPSPSGLIPAASVHPHDLANLDGVFDTKPYLTDTSDVVALLVLEHQVYIHNLIIHANYKSRMLMERRSPGSSTSAVTFEQLPPLMQHRFTVLLEPLVRAMLFVDSPRFPTHIRGGSGFAKAFEARGPRDPQGRSLRDFDLNTRLFKYPLSFLIYSQGFDFLPEAAKEYVYHRLDAILTGRDTSAAFSSLSAADRTAIFQILAATKPDFARAVAHDRGLAIRSGPRTAQAD